MPTKTSKAEAKRFQELKYKEKAGKISKLTPQVAFKAVINDVEVFKYTADFGYVEDGEKVIEEYKGFLYARHDFRLRMRVCSALYPKLLFRIVTEKGIETQYKAGIVFSRKPRKLGRPKLL